MKTVLIGITADCVEGSTGVRLGVGSASNGDLDLVGSTPVPDKTDSEHYDDPIMGFAQAHKRLFNIIIFDV